jgi:hypothetical protein
VKEEEFHASLSSKHHGGWADASEMPRLDAVHENHMLLHFDDDNQNTSWKTYPSWY